MSGHICKKFSRAVQTFAGGQLFRCETLGKHISKKQLGVKIFQLVNAADPHKPMSVHFLRKIAASLN